MQIIAGAIIGVLVVAGLVGVAYYFFKNPEKFKSLLMSFLRTALYSLCLCDSCYLQSTRST
jgi:hypothetical protein